MEALLADAYRTGWNDGVEDERESGPAHADCAAEGFQNWLSNNIAKIKELGK